MANEKLEVNFTEDDCYNITNGIDFHWTFETDKGRSIDIHLFKAEEDDE